MLSHINPRWLITFSALYKKHLLEICRRFSPRPKYSNGSSSLDYLYSDFSKLSPDVISDILTSTESHTEINQGLAHYIESNQLPANHPNEDARSDVKLLTIDGMCFGVFDGHGGYACSKLISECLSSYIAIALLNKYNNHNEIYHCLQTYDRNPFYDKLVKWISAQPTYLVGDLDKVVKASLRQFYLEKTELKESQHDLSIEQRLKEAFTRLDNDLTGVAVLREQEQITRAKYNLLRAAFSGSCATVAYLSNDDLYVANIGDSRAYVGSINEKGKLELSRMSHDHNAFNNDEMLRISSLHPNEVSTVISEDRLLGILEPFRSFGDVRLKLPAQELNEITTRLSPNSFIERYGSYIIPPNYKTPPYLIADPEIIHRKLSHNDRFLIIASDGLWDKLSPRKVQSLMTRYFYQSKKKRVSGNQTPQSSSAKFPAKKMDSNCATFLVRNALGLNDESVSFLLSLSMDEARLYRDDISITIVHFIEPS